MCEPTTPEARALKLAFADLRETLAKSRAEREAKGKQEPMPKLERSAFAYNGDCSHVVDAFDAEGDCW